MALSLPFHDLKCCFRGMKTVFMNFPRTYFSRSLWCFEQKSEYEDESFGHFKAGGNARLLLGALATFTTISLMVEKRAFCANEINEEEKEPYSSSDVTKPNRSNIREKTKLIEISNGGYLRKSLQELGVEANMNYLINELQRLRNQKKANQQKIEKCKGLLELLKLLVVVECPISFQEAFETYDGYQLYSNNTPQGKLGFRDLLLHPVSGLPVYIMFKPNVHHIIAIRPDGSHHTESLLRWLFLERDQTKDDNLNEERGLTLNASNTAAILESMESEWDRKCARVLLGSTRSDNELQHIGLDANKIRAATKVIVTGVQECENAKLAAYDIVNLRIASKVKQLSQEIVAMKDLQAKKRNSWAHERLQELQEKIETAEKSQEQFLALKESETNYTRQRLQQMQKRTANRLLEENRIKRRRLGAGPHDKIDVECEEFIAKAIESKATYHGRLKETVMFTNRRVKVRDLLNITNYDLENRGKVPIKSAITAWNRSRARNSRSIQSGRHRGNALFCTKKPPKTEDQMNENTHYQRAHVHHIKTAFYGSSTPEHIRKLNFMRSIDDKAYLRHGTSEGFSKTRNSRILTMSTQAKARKLPKYDWPESQMYITPSTHRIFSQEPVVVDGKERLLMKNDKHIVVIRPKAHVDSSGTTWASETERLRLLYPDEFEATNLGKAHSKHFRSLCAAIHDDVFLYVDMTEQGDIIKITTESSCKHRLYEQQ